VIVSLLYVSFFAIAILRYHLFDIDVIINRTLVYTALTVCLGAAYGASVVLIQGAFLAMTDQRSSLALIVSTLAIAAMFHPLRRQIQTAVDRRFYRRRYDAARTLASFAAAARDEVDIDRLAGRLTEVVEDTMQPTQVSLWLRTGARPPT
jgi:hypothetical protein